MTGMLDVMSNQPDPAAEKAAIENEWERMQGLGRRIRNKRIVAGLVASAIFLVGVVVALAIEFGTDDPHDRRGTRGKGYAIAFPLVISWSVAGFVGKKLWPKGLGVR